MHQVKKQCKNTSRIFLQRNPPVKNHYPTKSAVITGGTYNEIGPEKDNENKGSASNCPTISGGQDNTIQDSSFQSNANGATVTGGHKNKSKKRIGSVVTGGKGNTSAGEYSVVVGGTDNIAKRDLSIALGTQVQATKRSSMVINLNTDRSSNSKSCKSSKNNPCKKSKKSKNGATKLKSDTAGQFLANAKSFRFQIGTNDENLSIDITANNIQNLIDALDAAAAAA